LAGGVIRIKGDPGSATFLEAYNAVHREMAAKKHPAAANKVIPGSLRALINDYKASGEYRQNNQATQKSHMRVIDWLLP
jgi:hypothetical protein